MSRLPIRVRLTLVFAVVMTIVLAALGAFLYLRLGSTLDERVNERLQARSAALALGCGGRRDARRGSSVSSGRGRSRAGDRFGRIDRRGASATPARSQLLTDDELERAQGARIVIERIVEGSDGDSRWLGSSRNPSPVTSGRVVLVGESLEDRDEALDALLTQLLIALPLALLVSSAHRLPRRRLRRSGRWRRCGAEPARSRRRRRRGASRCPPRMTRCTDSGRRSTRCSSASTPASSASGASSPTRATSSERRSRS